MATEEPHDAESGQALLERGRALAAERAWERAYQTLAEADALTPLAPEDLERLMRCAALTNRDQEMLRVLERLHQHHVENGEPRRAARAAFWLAFRLSGLGEVARAGGWVARAERCLENEPGPCAEHGYLSVLAGTRSLVTGDTRKAAEAARAAVELGLVTGDRELLLLARNLEGRARLRLGEVQAGLTLLDESMLAATSGALSPILVGLLYCWTIAGCQRVYALDRSREWTRALSDWCAEQPELATFTGACSVHRAEIWRWCGEWQKAGEEARRVAEDQAFARDPVRGSAAYEQGEIHRLRGELSEAEDAYRRAHELGRDPQPGLALLRLAQGDRATAEQSLARALAGAPDPQARGVYLPAWIDVSLALGKVEEADRAAGALERLAENLGTDVAAALAAQARGSVLIAEGEPARAIGVLREAFRIWQEFGAPYLVARIRLLLAAACRALGDREGAELELTAAREAFERLGAAVDLESESGGAKGRSEHGLTAREIEVLRLVAAGKTNKAIAGELHLSERTVDRHVSNILTKTGSPSRAAATAFAYERRLV